MRGSNGNEAIGLSRQLWLTALWEIIGWVIHHIMQEWNSQRKNYILVLALSIVLESVYTKEETSKVIRDEIMRWRKKGGRVDSTSKMDEVEVYEERKIVRDLFMNVRITTKFRGYIKQHHRNIGI